MRRVLISTKPFIFVLFPVGVTVRSVESLSSAISLGTSTERANSKRANHGRSRLFQDAISSVSFWLRSFSVCGWRTRSLSSMSGPPTRWSYVRGWSLFATWCSSRREDPWRCTIGVVLSFLQERLERRLSPSALKVYVTTMQWTAGPWESMISSWGSWRGPGGWIPPGLPLCPLGTSLSSWLDFRGAPLSRWTQSSWSSCLLRQRSWPRSLPSNGSGTSRRFR